MQDAKCTLVAHPHKALEGEFQYHALLEGHKVTHILQEEELWSIVVTETEVGGHEGILKDKEFSRFSSSYKLRCLKQTDIHVIQEIVKNKI